MTVEIALLLVIIAVSMVLFSLERIPSDVVAIGVLLALAILGLLPAEEVFAGFGSDAVIVILGLLILSEALFRTGVVEVTGRAILRRTGKQPDILLIVIMGASALIGAFISNTASTAFFIPVVLGIARRARISPSRLLMPLAFSSILSSSVTLVSTSTNIVVSGLMASAGQPPMGMFELAPVGVPIAVVGLAYMFFIGRRLVPDRAAAQDSNSEGNQDYLTELVILPGSTWIGKTLAEIDLGRDLDLNVTRILRGKNHYMFPYPDIPLEEGDVLLVEGPSEEILKIKTIQGIDIKADVKLSEPESEPEDLRLVEAIVLIRSRLVGRTLKGIRFRQRYGLRVLAINRRGETIRRKLSQIKLQVGDVLLIQGHQGGLAVLEDENMLRVLSSLEGKLPNLRNAPVAILAFLGAILLASLNLLSFPIAVFLAVLVVFITRTLSPAEAYRQVEWRAVFLIGSMLGLGAALEHTGASEFLAGQIISFSGGAGPLWLLTAYFFLTVILTQPMSNQAAAVVIVPIALQTAAQLGLNPRTFAMMIAVAASTSYLTPLEPSCLMVYGPGHYRFTDFLKVGSLLTLLIYGLAIVLVPVVWPLQPR